MRIEQVAPVQSKHNGLWACNFKLFHSWAGEEYLASEVKTAAVWFDKDAALKAGSRAMEVLEQTGKWPNLCEVW